MYKPIYYQRPKSEEVRGSLLLTTPSPCGLGRYQLQTSDSRILALYSGSYIQYIYYDIRSAVFRSNLSGPTTTYTQTHLKPPCRHASPVVHIYVVRGGSVL